MRTFPKLAAFAKQVEVTCNVIEGYFRTAEIRCFAPFEEASKMEGSKALTKPFMRKHSMPTAKYENLPFMKRP